VRYEEIISEQDIDAVWGNANFGDCSRRFILKDTLIKCLAGYSTGRTAKCICIELCLIYANKWALTAKGRKYLGEYLIETEKIL
jgi:hypothetical protein